MRIWAGLMVLVPAIAHAGGYCGSSYRPTYSAPYVAPTYYQAPTYYTPTYYTPYPLQVQVYEDRAFRLSDLYRDKLLLEMWDLTKSRLNTLESERPTPAREASGGYRDPSPAATAPRTSQATRKASYAPTSKAAAKVLSENCASCHGKGNEHIDLSDPDSVPLTLRRASFGLAIARDMPQPPPELRSASKEKELEEWKASHGLKEQELNDLYSGWVIAPALAKK